MDDYGRRFLMDLDPGLSLERQDVCDGINAQLGTDLGQGWRLELIPLMGQRWRVIETDGTSVRDGY